MSADNRFYALVPNNDIALTGYEEALDSAFSDSRIRNIALTGAYGSGKSSVIRTYENKRPERTFLHVSLACFQDQPFDAVPDRRQTLNELESRILNQLLSQIPPQNIPRSQFRLKKETSRFQHTLWVAGLLAFSALVLYLLRFPAWTEIVRSLPDSWLRTALLTTVNPYGRLIGLLLCFALAGAGLSNLLNAHYLQSLIKKAAWRVSPGSDVFDDEESTYFDRYLDDVLYVFERCGADAIVFEDIDRRDVTPALEKLREISDLLIARGKGGVKDGAKGAPRFFYLIRDDVFSAEDRNKFFDFIIPVVPFVDASNACDQLLHRFEDAGFEDLFNRRFLQDVSLYLTDMRFVSNLVNEYVVYNNRLGEGRAPGAPRLNADRQLAMLIYKNLYPEDFNLLQQGRGYVYTLFEQRGALIVQRCHQLGLDGENRPEEDERLAQADAQFQTMNLQELLDGLDESSFDFWGGIQPPYEPEDYAEKLRHTKSFPLLKYLIRNGYINENYAAYISYFYSDSITPRDRDFLLALTDRRELGYDYRLERPDVLLERLGPGDFARKELLNFDLLDHLLQSDLLPELRIWLRASDGEASAAPFWIAFWRTRRSHEPYVKLLNTEQPTWFWRWSLDGLLEDEDFRAFAVDALCILDERELKKLNQEGWLKERIEQDEAFLQLDKPDVEQLVRGLETLGVRFAKLVCRDRDRPLLSEVYRRNLYELNLDTIKLLLTQFWGLPEELVLRRSYSFLYRDPDSPLARRVWENPEDYLKLLLSETELRFSDDEEAVIDLLNRETISPETKAAYIDRMDTALTDLGKLTDVSVWTSLLESGRLAKTWQVIADSYRAFNDGQGALRPELVRFIDSFEDPPRWTYDSLDRRIGHDCADRLRDAVVQDTLLSPQSYRRILLSMGFSFDDFHFAGIPEERMRVLFDLKIVELSGENIALLRQNYPQLLNDFIFSAGITRFVRMVESGEADLGPAELAALLEDPRLEEDVALRLIAIFDMAVPLNGRHYPTAVVERLILGGYLDEDGIGSLLHTYEQEEPPVREAFLRCAVANWETVASAARAVRRIPVNIYATCLKQMTPETALELRPFLADENFEIACTQSKRPRFDNTPDNRAILDYFQTRRWISSYSDRGDFLQTYAIRK